MSFWLNYVKHEIHKMPVHHKSYLWVTILPCSSFLQGRWKTVNFAAQNINNFNDKNNERD